LRKNLFLGALRWDAVLPVGSDVQEWPRKQGIASPLRRHRLSSAQGVVLGRPAFQMYCEKPFRNRNLWVIAFGGPP
jgi:hypothetical protein